MLIISQGECRTSNNAMFYWRYTGRISDKEITTDTDYLDIVPPYTALICDKGFNITEECAVHHISHYVPPGKCGASLLRLQRQIE